MYSPRAVHPSYPLPIPERTVESDRAAINLEIGPAPVFVTLPLETVGGR